MKTGKLIDCQSVLLIPWERHAAIFRDVLRHCTMRPLYDAAPSGSAMLDILDIIADSVSISAKSTPCRALVGAISVHQCSNARSIVIQEKARQKQNAPLFANALTVEN
jgi:hypothetical protein